MVELSPNTIFGLILEITVTSVVFLSVLLVVLKICRKSKVLLPFANFGLIKPMLIVGLGAVLSFMLVASTSKASAKRRIYVMLKNLENCDAIKVYNSFYDRDSASGIPVTQDILIHDPCVIQNLADLMHLTPYAAEPAFGHIGTEELVEIHIYKNEIETDCFCVISMDILEFDGPSKRRRYSSPGNLIDKVREVVGCNGIWSYRETYETDFKE